MVVLWVTVTTVAMAMVRGGCVCAQEPSDLPPINHSHSIVLDQEGAFVMLWTPHDDAIDIEVQVSHES